MTAISLIVCTKNRSVSLQKTLRSIDQLEVQSAEIEIIVVDNDSSDNTKYIIEGFINESKLPAKYVFCKEAGLGNARNCGLKNSSSSWIVFSDDDCLFDTKYLIEFISSTQYGNLAYGSGQILLANDADDPRVANLILKERVDISANVFLPAGTIQGANMFFRRDVFNKVGVFNPLMGPGTPFVCDDIEMAARASLGGFLGAQLPNLIVYHDHGRKKFSQEAEETVRGYDLGRGAYYASLLKLGQSQIWMSWHRNSVYGLNIPINLARYLRELEGAFKYLSATSGLHPVWITPA
jgi:glycosyltransferase involved in cell wall biosynthesis